eukprot:675696-Alexandrium_andersonii.AAC.1
MSETDSGRFGRLRAVPGKAVKQCKLLESAHSCPTTARNCFKHFRAGLSLPEAFSDRLTNGRDPSTAAHAHCLD